MKLVEKDLNLLGKVTNLVKIRNSCSVVEAILKFHLCLLCTNMINNVESKRKDEA